MSANTRLQMSHDIKVSLNLTGKITTLSGALKKFKCSYKKLNFLKLCHIT